MIRRATLLSILAMSLIACRAGTDVGPGTAAAPAATGPSGAAPNALVAYVYKSPTCSCCHEWEAYLRRHGYTIHPIPTDDMAAIKTQMNVPESAWSCHTAVIDGYVVEGHVPVEAINDLLSQRPEIDGIALPAMPPGSPGMPGVKQAAFSILSLSNGQTSSFGAY